MKFKFKQTGQVITALSKEQEDKFKSDKRFELIVEKETDNSAQLERVALLEKEVARLKTANKKLRAENKKLKT